MANALKTLFTDIAGAIRETLPDEGKMSPNSFPNKIREAVAAGGSSEDICYVTFMSEDGATEYGKKAVISGDDCMEPVSHGLFSKPTKNPTNTVVYNHSGWSTIVNGSADSSALLNVTEDRVVYATYAESVRYYTVRFFDGDELKNTLEVTYGATANYSLEKDGYNFEGWEPSNVNITANIDCYAKWTEGITFASAPWSKIAEISEAGNAKDYFAVGDTKTLVLTNGTTCMVEIVGFDHDILTSDNTKKAGITCLCKTVPNFTISHEDSYTMGKDGTYSYYNFDEKEWFDANYATILPEDLASAVKQVIKTSKYRRKSSVTSSLTTIKTSTSNEYLWIPSCYELGLKKAFTDMGYISTTSPFEDGVCYERFTDSQSLTASQYVAKHPVYIEGTSTWANLVIMRSQVSETTRIGYTASGFATRPSVGSSKGSFDNQPRFGFCI
jgi:hypothetical protein